MNRQQKNVNLGTLAFVDVETTGFRGARVIEIGIVRVEQGTVTGRLDSLIDPETHIPSVITQITGIDTDMVSNAPTFYSVAEEIEVLLHNAVFVAHCVDFDYGMLTDEFARLGKSFSYPRLCSRNLSRAIHPHEKSHSLESLISRHGLVVDARHRAHADADALWQFWQRCVAGVHDATAQGMVRFPRAVSWNSYV